MPSVLISELDTSPALVGTDMLMVQHSAGPPAEVCRMTQVATYVYATTVALTNQTTSVTCATGAVSFFASSPAGFVTVSINGTSVKLPYYNP